MLASLLSRSELHYAQDPHAGKAGAAPMDEGGLASPQQPPAQPTFRFFVLPALLAARRPPRSPSASSPASAPAPTNPGVGTLTQHLAIYNASRRTPGPYGDVKRSKAKDSHCLMHGA